MKLWQIEAVGAVGVVLGLLIFMRGRNAVCGTSTAPVSESIVKACALTMSINDFLGFTGFLFAVASLTVLIITPVLSHLRRRTHQLRGSHG
jgi:uncharacterized membrane protein